MSTMSGDFPHQDTDRGPSVRDAAVEFDYQPTAADFEEALRARARRTPAGRAQALLAPLAAVVAVVVFTALRAASLPVGIVSLVISVGVASWGTLRGLRTMARRMHSIVEPYGPGRMVADDRRAVFTGERVSFTNDWTVFREYLETPHLFVLLSGERAAGLAVLPKRGARVPADVDRLRAILDRNLKRR
ncbi:YcxB family protein [Streptomyces sp. URMC 123]|uniref:YcxB family protein n=1 Tax=Streptomyces sp. URMC 123 TaxID=3423403 RepID=UPI003F1C330E